MHPRFKRLSLITTLSIALIMPTFSASTALANNEALTRGEFIQQIVKELNLSPTDKSLKLPTDVSDSSTYAQAARVMLERQAMNGYEDGTFRLDQPITKKESSQVIGRFLGIQDHSALDKLEKHFGASFGKDNSLSLETAQSLIQTALSNSVEASQWAEKSAAEQVKVTSFLVDSQMDMNIFTKPDSGEAGPISTNSSIQIKFNKNSGIHQLSTTEMDLPTGPIQTEIEQYTVTQGTYIKMPDPVSGNIKWFNLSKQIPFTFEQLMELQLKNQELNKTFISPYFFFRDLGVEEKDGVKLHGIELNGKLTNTAELLKTLGSLLNDSGLLQSIAESPALSQMSMSMSAIYWFDEQTKLVAQTDVDYVIQYGDDKANPLDRMEMTMTATYTDYNQVKDIVLPDEAKKAEELSIPEIPVTK
ncbi:hypothetical protein D3C73_561320 [compost metagenome]